jgi:hypothetical protein
LLARVAQFLAVLAEFQLEFREARVFCVVLGRAGRRFRLKRRGDVTKTMITRPASGSVSSSRSTITSACWLPPLVPIFRPRRITGPVWRSAF